MNWYLYVAIPCRFGHEKQILGLGIGPRMSMVGLRQPIGQEKAWTTRNQIGSSTRESFEDPGDAGRLEDWIDPGRGGPPPRINSKLNVLSLANFRA